MFSQFRSLWKWALPAFLALAGAQVQAATVSYTAAPPMRATNISGTVTLPYFDPALGTLTAARIKTRLQFGGTITLSLSSTSMSGAPVTEPALMSGTTTVAINYGSSISLIQSAVGAQPTTGSYTTSEVLLNPGESWTSPPYSWVQPDYTVSTFSSPAELAVFQSPGTFDITYRSSVEPLQINGNHNGNGGGGRTTGAGVTFIVEYDYTVTVPQIDLTLAKTLTSSGPYAPGSTVTFNLLASNGGPGTAQPAIVVTDTLPAGLSFVSATGTGTEWACSAAGQVVTCTRSANAAPLASGAAAGPITLAAKVAAGATGTLTNVAYVAPAAGEAAAESNPANGYDDGNPATGSNNDASASVTVTAPTPPAPVPTLGEWSLLLLGGLLTTLGMGAQRRRG
jgi:uncharacterized repeat protein (TIGR01451 family)